MLSRFKITTQQIQEVEPLRSRNFKIYTLTGFYFDFNY